MALVDNSIINHTLPIDYRLYSEPLELKLSLFYSIHKLFYYSDTSPQTL